MVRKAAIALCVLGVLAPLVLWIESLRPRYTLFELEAQAPQQGVPGRVSADPAQRDAHLLRQKVENANCDTSSRLFAFGRRTFEVSLSHRLVSPREVPGSTQEQGGMTLTISQGGPRTVVQSPGVLGFCYTRLFAPGEKVVRGTTIGSKAGFHFARISHVGTNPSVMYSLAFPVWRLSLLFLLGLACFGIRPLRRYRRRKRGLCVICKYDLRGTESGRCPECGTAISNLKSQIGDLKSGDG